MRILITVFLMMVGAVFTASLAYAQTMSGAGVGSGIDRAVTQSCDMEYRNLRTNISTLVQRVNALLECNRNGQTLKNGSCAPLPLGPDHAWQGTVLKLANPDGEWAAGYDLRGPQGDRGSDVECYTPVADSSSSGASSSGASSSGASSSGASSSGASSSGASSSGASSSGASSTSGGGPVEGCPFPGGARNAEHCAYTNYGWRCDIPGEGTRWYECH